MRNRSGRDGNIQKLQDGICIIIFRYSHIDSVICIGGYLTYKKAGKSS